MLILKRCPKAYTRDQDKALSPEQTVARVKARLAERADGVLAETDRVDTGRLGIPVYVSVCGPRAALVMPTRKQMGKGASPAQAEASALMELVERFSFFSFFDDDDNFEYLTFSEAEARWPGGVVPLERILQSVGESLDPEAARRVLDTRRWAFAPALDVAAGREVRLPLDWFRALNEFNGSSAGNSPEESVLQGSCELVERHVCAVIDRTRPELPTIDPAGLGDPVLTGLLDRFTRHGIRVLLKDFTLGQPAPTVAALAWDPSTFPGMSEIVFTAGTASSPVKAAIRALTEVAQLAGDFETGRVYEASGLSKFTDPAQFAWLQSGPVVPLAALPSLEDPDIFQELMALARGLAERGHALYAVDTTQADIDVPAHYNIVPGFLFRERTPSASLGMFVGRMLAENADEDEAADGLAVIAGVYPDAAFLPFFEGLLALRTGDHQSAAEHFAASESGQAAAGERALSAFYQAYALAQMGLWPETLPHLERAIALDPEVKEFHNLKGVALFKARDFAAAAAAFSRVLDIDSSSAADLANLGLCHKNLGRPEEAADYLESALRLDPDLDWARDQLEELRGTERMD
ncbi:MAG: YcaO-like family protein [Desulfovibrionaceae bacterium]